MKKYLRERGDMVVVMLHAKVQLKGQWHKKKYLRERGDMVVVMLHAKVQLKGQ
jgi:hypothetical protein